MPDTRRLVVFDLDGTISRHDTLVPYIAGVLRRRPWRVLRLALALPGLVSYLLRIGGRGPLKSALLRAALGGLSRRILMDWSERYVRQVIPARLHAEALARIEAHRAAGDHLVLMSASPDLYVPVIGRELGFREVVCTEVGWSGDRFTGRLLTANRQGHEKTRCLEALRAAHPGLPVTAYGNSGGDVEHLSRCEEGVYVNARPWQVKRLRELRLTLVHWA